ncbi:unnamed protein product [Polarella glacialis]|uniref:Alpha/beta hydrolase fold-3 domain-containing protein n=2 Tax=Polarella glacialis TaxID=89957 RepID=A0A813H9S6_POLGL|nr:unnamed protein product [Polarella glacialis]CAE8634585.1 unnamed protein product [Polarella glacialis]
MANEGEDYLPPSLIDFCARSARGDIHGKDWRVSPVYLEGPLHNLPPIMVVYGECELLRGQVEHFCKAWSMKGADIRPWPVEGGVHAPILFQHVWEPSQRALSEVARFVNECGSRDASPVSASLLEV